VAGHRHQRVVPVRMSVAAEQSEDNHPATANLARHLVVQVLAKREADQREDKAPTVNLPSSQKAKRQLRLRKGRGNQSAERKRARGLHRQGLNYLANFRGGSGVEKFRSRFV
jgi:hypothetical protein